LQTLLWRLHSTCSMHTFLTIATKQTMIRALYAVLYNIHIW
jgi:hypothetical protein